MKLISHKAALFCGLAILALSGQAPVRAQDASAKKPVLIVIRHGEDRKGGWINGSDGLVNGTTPLGWGTEKWKNSVWKTQIAPNWPEYALPANTVTVDASGTSKTALPFIVNQHGLSTEGEKQALFLRDVAYDILTKELGYAPITRIVTKLPSGTGPNYSWPTPNPFDTVYPLAQKLKDSVELMLIKPELSIPKNEAKNDETRRTMNPVDPGLSKMLPDIQVGATPKWDTLMDGKGSTLLCWDAEGLWGLDLSNDERSYNLQSILFKMGSPSLSEYFSGMGFIADAYGRGVPEKGTRLYVFTRREPSPKPDGYDCTIYRVANDGTYTLVQSGSSYSYTFKSGKETGLEEKAKLTVTESGNELIEKVNAAYYHDKLVHPDTPAP